MKNETKMIVLKKNGADVMHQATDEPNESKIRNSYLGKGYDSIDIYPIDEYYRLYGSNGLKGKLAEAAPVEDKKSGEQKFDFGKAEGGNFLDLLEKEWQK